MKNNIFTRALFPLAVTLLAVCSCELNELDNYDAPDCSLHGKVIDITTGELVGSELNNGTQIQVVQLGFETKSNTYLLVKPDGTFRNDLMFKGTYRIQPNVRNFVQIEADTVDVKGDMNYDLHVIPYISFSEDTIYIDGETVYARFKIKNNLDTAGYVISKLSLYVGERNTVGNTLRNSASKILTLNDNLSDTTVYTMPLPLNLHRDELSEGKKYFFRIGARSSLSGAVDNYGCMVQLPIPTLSEPVTDGVMISDCDHISVSGVGQWHNNNNGGQPAVKLDGFDFTQGEASVVFGLSPTTKSPFRIQYKGNVGTNTGATLQNGVLKFDLYVDDPTNFCTNLKGGQIELTSSGASDKQELNWSPLTYFKNLQPGWNHIELPFNKAGKTGGTFNPANVNYFRFFGNGTGFNVTLKIDNFRVCINE